MSFMLSSHHCIADSRQADLLLRTNRNSRHTRSITHLLIRGGLLLLRLLLLIGLATGLSLKILRLLALVFLSDRASGIIGTTHLNVIAALDSTFSSLKLDNSLLVGNLIGTVELAIVLGIIDTRLLRGVVRRRRILRIPITQKYVNIGSALHAGRMRMPYHLMANRVTRGFSASMLRTTRSTSTVLGGSFWSSSLSYSLLT